MDYINILQNSYDSINLLIGIIESDKNEIKKIEIIQKKLLKWLN